jgi:hypothetical protein
MEAHMLENIFQQDSHIHMTLQMIVRSQVRLVGVLSRRYVMHMVDVCTMS